MSKIENVHQTEKIREFENDERTPILARRKAISFFILLNDSIVAAAAPPTTTAHNLCYFVQRNRRRTHTQNIQNTSINQYIYLILWLCNGKSLVWRFFFSFFSLSSILNRWKLAIVVKYWNRLLNMCARTNMFEEEKNIARKLKRIVCAHVRPPYAPEWIALYCMNRIQRNKCLLLKTENTLIPI